MSCIVDGVPSEEASVEPERSLATVADKLLAPLAVIAVDSTVLYVNASAAHVLGQEPAWLIGRRMLPLVHREDRRRVQRELRAVADGRRSAGTTTYRVRTDTAQHWRVLESIADNLLDDPRVGGILLSSRDITAQVAHQEELRRTAYFDTLTGLPNRAGINDELASMMTTDIDLTVGLIGLDRLRYVNDSWGHSAGDAVLQVTVDRIRLVVPEGVSVGRFSGDVLIVVIPGAVAQDAAALLWRVVTRLAETMFVDGHEFRLTASAGIASRCPTSTPESLLRDAGVALHRAKAEGGGRVTRFEGAMRDAAIARLELEADLRRATALRELTLALQCIVKLDDASPAGAEALLRWRRGDEAVEPARFIPVAEETGLIVPLGDWIIDRAARLAARSPGGYVSVNLSPRQLAAPALPVRVARILNSCRVPAANVGFEITESSLIEHFDHSAETLCKLRQLGCRVGLDDFGTGFSSLGYLRRLPLDFIKIDRALTADIDADVQARAIVGAILTMADALGLDVIAEGVETEAQASTLRELGCGFAQGFLFGSPTEVEPSPTVGRSDRARMPRR